MTINLKLFHKILFSLLYFNYISVFLSSAQTIDILKSFQPGREWAYSLSIIREPGFNTSSDIVYYPFQGTCKVKVSQIINDEKNNLRLFKLTIEKKGTEKAMQGRETKTTREIDTIYFTEIIEYLSKNFRAGSNHIKGWLFLDTIPARWRSCPHDTTFYYPYSLYYRYYNINTPDTFDVRGKRIVFNSSVTDCLDNGLLWKYTIVPDSGIVEYKEIQFNYFDVSTTIIYHLINTKLESRQTSPLPEVCILGLNYPNPFNPSTRIEYSIPMTGFVGLRVYDIFGREVSTLVNKQQTPGSYYLIWNPENLSSGVYFYKIIITDKLRQQYPLFNMTRKMLYIR